MKVVVFHSIIQIIRYYFILLSRKKELPFKKKWEYLCLHYILQEYSIFGIFLDLPLIIYALQDLFMQLIYGHISAILFNYHSSFWNILKNFILQEISNQFYDIHAYAVLVFRRMIYYMFIFWIVNQIKFSTTITALFVWLVVNLSFL